METKEFNSEKLVNKTTKSKGWAIAVICLGILRMLFEDWSEGLFKVLDSLFIPGFGIILYVTAYKRVNRVQENYIKLQPEMFEFKSRNENGNYSDVLKLKDIEITLETIKITDDEDIIKTIYLDDYIGDGEQKEIKLIFNKYKELIKSQNKGS